MIQYHTDFFSQEVVPGFPQISNLQVSERIVLAFYSHASGGVSGIPVDVCYNFSVSVGKR